MGCLIVTVEHYKAWRLRLHIAPLDCLALGGGRRTLQIPGKRIVRKRYSPLSQSTWWHSREMAFPWCVGGSADFKIREVCLTSQNGQRYLTPLNAAFQIVHHQNRLVHFLDIEFCFRAHDLQT